MTKKVFIFWTLLISLTLFRLFNFNNKDHIKADWCVKEIVEGIGIIREQPQKRENGQIFILAVKKLEKINEKKECGSNFLIKIKTKFYPEVYLGDEIIFRGKLLKPQNFNNNGRVFDYKNYLAKDEIYHEIKSAEIEVIQRENYENFQDYLIGKLFRLKKAFVNSLEKNLGEPYSALASGLVVGEKAALGNDLLDDFRKVGLIHIVVLSGYNITIVADAIRRLFSFFPRLWGIFFGGIGIFLFGILVGGGATVVRSCFMAGIVLLAEIIRRDYSVVRALIFVGLIMIIQNPMILFHDPSFQLSFLATLGLIVLAKPIEDKLFFITKRFGIRGIIASTVATQIFVSPYILYTMGQISIIGMIVNILVLPFIPLTMLFVFIAGTLGIFSVAIAQPFAWISHALLSYELFMVEFFSELSFASVNVDSFSFWWVVGFYVLLASALVWKRYKLIIINN